MGNLEGVLLTPLRIIKSDLGDVMHALKQKEDAFQGFGEAYFSIIHYHAVKGWKKHRKMILNVIVPVGMIKFVLYDDRLGSNSYQLFQEILLSVENYQRLTVPPGIWMAFQGLDEHHNILLNIASIPHDPLEAENLPIQNDFIPFDGFVK
jgi:dTDP-4-dehydrorhamnose 3,5-epimerase